MIRKTIKVPQGSSHLLSFEGCKFKQLPSTPIRSTWPARRLGSGFEGLERTLPPKEARRGSRRHRTGNKIPTEVSSLDFAEVTRETKVRRAPRPAQPANRRSQASTLGPSLDDNLSDGERTERRLFDSIEKDTTDVQPRNESRYTAGSTHAESPVHLPPVCQQSKTTTTFVHPIIALHRNTQSRGNNEDPPAGRVGDQPRHQARHMRRRVTFEDEIYQQPPGPSLLPLQKSTVPIAKREIEAGEEVISRFSSQPRKGDESDTKDPGKTDVGDLKDATAIASKYHQASQLKSLQIAANSAFSEMQDAMGISTMNEEGSPTTSILESDATSNVSFERRATWGSDIKNSESLGTPSLATPFRRTIERESQALIPQTDDKLWKVVDDIVDDYSPILSAGNHRAIRRRSLVLSTALHSSPPPSSNPPSPCRLRAETPRGTIRWRSEIPETQKSYEQAASQVTPMCSLRSILKKGQ